MRAPGAARVAPPVTRLAGASVAAAVVVGTVAKLPSLPLPRPLKNAAAMRVTRVAARREDASGRGPAGRVRGATRARARIARRAAEVGETAVLVGTRAPGVRRVETGRAKTQGRLGPTVGRRRGRREPRRGPSLVGTDGAAPRARTATAGVKAAAGAVAPVPAPVILTPIPGARTATGGATGGAAIKVGVGHAALAQQDTAATAAPLGRIEPALVAPTEGGVGPRIRKPAPRPVAVPGTAP